MPILLLMGAIVPEPEVRRPNKRYGRVDASIARAAAALDWNGVAVYPPLPNKASALLASEIGKKRSELDDRP